MQRLISVLVILLIVLAASGSVLAAEPARLALVVGNSAYAGDAALRNPTNDARDVASGLQKLGWKVTLATDIDRRSFNRVVTAFKNDLGQSAGASALFYYAGHGIQVTGANFLVPVDAQLETVEDVKSEALNLDVVTSAMEEARVGISLVILDACRDNPFVKKMTRSLGGTRGLSAVPNNAGTQGAAVIFSTSPGDVAQDGTGRNGVFTTALLKYLASDLQIEDLFKKVSADVRTASGGAQKPWINSSLTTSFSLAGGKTEALSPFSTVSATQTSDLVPVAPAAVPASAWRLRAGAMVGVSYLVTIAGLTVGISDALSPTMNWFADLDVAPTDLAYGGGVEFLLSENFRVGVGYQGISNDVLGICGAIEINRWRVKLGLTPAAALLDVTYALTL